MFLGKTLYSHSASLHRSIHVSGCVEGTLIKCWPGGGGVTCALESRPEETFCSLSLHAEEIAISSGIAKLRSFLSIALCILIAHNFTRD